MHLDKRGRDVIRAKRELGVAICNILDLLGSVIYKR